MSKKYSNYYGVCFSNQRNLFQCNIYINQKSKILGFYDNELDAAIAYDNAVKFYNLDRRLNFPEPEPENLIPNTKLIRLNKGKFAVVDEEDFEWLNQFKWACLKHRYTYYAYKAIRVGEKISTVKMHRLILGNKIPLIDHINRNGLHNYKSNLRPANTNENQQNRRIQENCASKYKGVCVRKSNGKFTSSIRINKNLITLGTFSNEIEAAKAYDTAAKEHFGEFARTNF